LNEPCLSDKIRAGSFPVSRSWSQKPDLRVSIRIIDGTMESPAWWLNDCKSPQKGDLTEEWIDSPLWKWNWESEAPRNFIKEGGISVQATGGFSETLISQEHSKDERFLTLSRSIWSGGSVSEVTGLSSLTKKCVSRSRNLPGNHS
jgi:hypothetical protein